MMSKSKQALLSSGCLLALLVNGAGALAQKQEKTPPERRAQTRVMVTTVPPDGVDKVVMSGADDGYDIRFFSSEMSFDGQVVKGAPYAAEAVTESVQTLGDGNRIVRKSSALIYRDSEGRTRREQTLNNVGPFATAGDAPHVIFINDPVAGVNYSLDARTHTARKGTFAFYYFNSDGPAGSPQRFKRMAPPPDGPGEPPPPGPDGALPGFGPPPPGPPQHEAIKRVQPEYPAVAKAAGAQGPVSVQVVIDEQGNVSSARAVSGHPLLQDAAVTAARQWVFKPTLSNGKPAKVTGTISFNFVLSGKDSDAPPPPQGPPPPWPEQKVKEPLGRQTIEGVEAEGTRVTVTIPAGAIGNEQVIKVVSERWYAPELQVVVMTKHSDPRFGEMTYRLTNINRTEPAHNLFEVPADFTIKPIEPMRREFMMKREPNEQ
jgi:TonB family protein